MNDNAVFLKDYEENIQRILSMPSGQHAPDPIKVEQWVEAQLSDRRKIAAKALADNIVYIPHQDLIYSISTLVDKVYGEKEIPADNKIILFSGPRTKSNYFISLLFYHFIKIKGYPEPDLFIQYLTPENRNHDGQKTTVFYVDDMSYSGSQIIQYLSNIYKTVEVNSKEPSWDIRVCLPFISENALNYLQNLNIPQGFGIINVKNPYPIYYIYSIPSLKKILGNDLYMDCVIYFTPISHADTICYFDHKIADALSTFLFVLLFGIIPPGKINWDILYHTESLKGKYAFGKYKNIDGPHKEEVYAEHINDKLNFIPLIKNCGHIKEFINRNLKFYQSLPYHMYMTTLEQHDLNVILNSEEINGKWIIKNKQSDPEKQKIVNFIKERNSVEIRCPKSWYKNFFKGGKRNTKRKLKNRKLSKLRKSRRH
jgi:hypothetical protein